MYLYVYHDFVLYLNQTDIGDLKHRRDIRKMFIAKIFIFLLWNFGEGGFCLNLTHTGNEVENLKESLLQLTTSVEQMKADYGRKEAYLRSEVDLLRNKTTLLESHNARNEVLFRSEIERVINETTLLKAQISSKSKLLKTRVYIISLFCKTNIGIIYSKAWSIRLLQRNSSHLTFTCFGQFRHNVA